MKTSSAALALAALFTTLLAAGCSNGQPKGMRAETLRPDQIHDFAVLYQENCSACHGENGRSGASLPLNNPVYLAWAGRDRMIDIAANGMPNTLMPGFAHSGGGLLTHRQIADIVDGMISHWGKTESLQGAQLPSYTATSKGDPAAGEVAYQTYCARCHGPGGDGEPVPQTESERLKAERAGKVVGSIVDPTYLSLISPQGLRAIVVAGMPGQGMPDWRQDASGKPMSSADIDNVVAWMLSKRVKAPGQPFPQLLAH